MIQEVIGESQKVGHRSPTGELCCTPLQSREGDLAVALENRQVTGAVIVGALAVGLVPTVLGAMGFTRAGIAASVLACKKMTAAAITSRGGVAVGSLVATLRLVGAAGLFA
ncbi:interferon alpha-inducible protein 27-like protein 2 [Peromyscus eremicus]|uniref:interferon alpha-inducible protein 27-like protein 2 n=1 Tax=Peromyscus eremicus TaxID=42410 RepID=UPI0027DE0D2C|nr:interferon alpha-inducible protein 27-like protein 2 [Peromyscus eremicus]